jgi:tRNA A37 threonylcarbamoyltransferase TsaD
LKGAWFQQPLNLYQVKIYRFQSCFKCNLYRYTLGVSAAAAAASSLSSDDPSSSDSGPDAENQSITPPPPPQALSCVVVAGGVAANQTVRARLAAIAEEAGLPLVLPPPRWCTVGGCTSSGVQLTHILKAWAPIA